MRGSQHYKRSDDYDHAELNDATVSALDGEKQLLREDLDFQHSFPAKFIPRHRQRRLHKLLRGPEPPRIQTIRPFFQQLQNKPLQFLEARKFKPTSLLAIVLLAWFFIATFFLSSQRPFRDGSGKQVVNLDCTDTVWRRKNECGLDGIDCRPFNNQTFAFRCPAKCADVQLLNPHAVGPVEVNYRPLVIGTEVYRGDSFICASSIHAGIMDDRTGGCGRLDLVEDHETFVSTKKHGIESISFESYFPKSFSVASEDSFRCPSDPRSALLPVSLLATVAMALFSTSPKIFFPIFTLIFAHVSFVSDPPSASNRNISVLPDHISMFVKRLLPAMFVAVVMYTTTIKRTLFGLTAQFEKAIFWLGGFWIGALSNYTFDWIPISRLTAHDLEQQPGAKLALTIIILVLIAIVVGQVHSFWLEGRLPRMLKLYGLFIFGIIFCLLVPGVNLRIHHYILALLFLPGTSIQTRRSLLYQGILLGLFVNGIARWDFDSILQTSNALRGDAKFNSGMPQLLNPIIDPTVEGLIATFKYVTPPIEVDAISVLVNDVERARIFRSGVEGVWGYFNWTRPNSMKLEEYFRFAYVQGGRTLDYRTTGTMFSNGTWGSIGHS